MKSAGQAKAFSLLKPFLLASCLTVALLGSGFEQSDMRVQSTASVGPRTLEKQTETSVIRDYQQAWQSLSAALEENRPDLLDADFVGIAKEKLTNTIQDQEKLGIQTRYRDRNHDIKLIFYSPEGLSIQLVDTVDYDVQEFLGSGKSTGYAAGSLSLCRSFEVRRKCAGRCASSRLCLISEGRLAEEELLAVTTPKARQPI